MFDELDEYVCPHCGHRNETCMCDDYYYDYDYYLNDEIEEEEIICYLDGKPIYKSDLKGY